MTKAKRIIAAAALLALALACVWWTRASWAAGMLVMAPSPQTSRVQRPQGVDQSLAVVRGSAEVRAWVFDPDVPVRGTVLLLHGIRDSKHSLVPGAHGHAAQGFRAVAVDSRGHGESSGAYLTYGVEESADLVALVDELARRGLLVEPLAVVGTSYGAATALQYAARDPRVDRVVALAPFASLRQVVPAYLEWILGPAGRSIPSELVNELIDGAVRQAGFDADRACPRCVAPRIRAPVLLIHSRDDERIPWQHSVQIRDALAAPAELMLVDGVGHVAIGRAEGVERAIERWLDGG